MGEARHGRLAHMLGFLGSGTASFVIDAGVLKGLIWLTGLSPLLCRPVSILTAMGVGWQLHRRFTFAVQGRSTLREFLHFASVGWSAAALNYGIFAGLLLAWPRLEPLLAMVVSSGTAMVYTYLGYRFFVFRKAQR